MHAARAAPVATTSRQCHGLLDRCLAGKLGLLRARRWWHCRILCRCHLGPLCCVVGGARAGTWGWPWSLGAPCKNCALRWWAGSAVGWYVAVPAAPAARFSGSVAAAWGRCMRRVSGVCVQGWPDHTRCCNLINDGQRRIGAAPCTCDSGGSGLRGECPEASAVVTMRDLLRHYPPP